MDKMKLNGYRAYFVEKQRENEKRKILEKEQAERAKEEEKKLKMVVDLMSAGSLVSWDEKGTFLPIKKMKETTFKTPPVARGRIADGKKVLDYNNMFGLDKKGRQNFKKSFEVDKEEVKEIEPKPVIYYQPDPIETMSLSKGTTLTYYDKKKEGGKFEVKDGRLTKEQYDVVLNEITLTNLERYGQINETEYTEKPYDLIKIETGKILEDQNEYKEEKEEKEKKKEGSKKETIRSKEGHSRKKKRAVRGVIGVPNYERLYFLFKDEVKK